MFAFGQLTMGDRMANMPGAVARYPVTVIVLKIRLMIIGPEKHNRCLRNRS